MENMKGLKIEDIKYFSTEKMKTSSTENTI